jgi:hypothetical protein
MKIKLNKSELKEALDLASQRHEAKHVSVRDTGPKMTSAAESKLAKFIGDPRYKPHFLGMLGEIAYAKMRGGEVNKEIYSKGDDNTGDVGNVEVKTSTWKGPDIDLKITQREVEKKENQPLKYALMRVDEDNFSEVEFIGEIYREEFLLKAKKKKYRLGFPMNYVLDGRKLYC